LPVAVKNVQVRRDDFPSISRLLCKRGGGYFKETKAVSISILVR